MKNWIVLALVGFMALPTAFAADETPQSNDEAIVVEGSDQQTTDVTVDATGESFYRHDDFRPPGHRPPRPGPRPPRPGPGPRPPRTAWICLARDLVRNGFRYVDYDLAWARHGALRECAYRSPVGRCYLVACDRY